MGGPSSKPKRDVRRDPPTFVPQPSDEGDVREGLEEASRGELLSAEDSAEYVRRLLEGNGSGG